MAESGEERSRDMMQQSGTTESFQSTPVVEMNGASMPPFLLTERNDPIPQISRYLQQLMISISATGQKCLVLPSSQTLAKFFNVVPDEVEAALSRLESHGYLTDQAEDRITVVPPAMRKKFASPQSAPTQNPIQKRFSQFFLPRRAKN